MLLVISIKEHMNRQNKKDTWWTSDRHGHRQFSGWEGENVPSRMFYFKNWKNNN